MAILRGLTPQRAPEVGAPLVAAGFRIIEVPLNSPEPFDTIKLLAAAHGADCLVGAGTVLTAAEVERVHGAGGRLVVAPNCDARGDPPRARTRHARAAWYRHRDRGLRRAAPPAPPISNCFPAATYGPRHLKALKSVLPKHVRVFPVGGVGSQDIAAWLASGADGFGFGSELFTPAYTLAQRRNARARSHRRAARRDDNKNSAFERATTRGST